MTENIDSGVVPTPTAALVPTGVRIASTLCWLVGILTILMAIAVGIPAATGSEATVAPMIVSIATGIVVCVAGHLVRQRRKVGALLVVAAWALPAVVSLVGGGGAEPGNVLLFAAMIALFLNWKFLH